MLKSQKMKLQNNKSTIQHTGTLTLQLQSSFFFFNLKASPKTECPIHFSKGWKSFQGQFTQRPAEGLTGASEGEIN